MSHMSSPVTISAGLAVELYFVRQALDTYTQHGRSRETVLATLSILEACLREALELTLVSVDPQLWYPIRHCEGSTDPWPRLAATITDPIVDETVAEAAFVELGYRLRFLATKLRGKYKWDIFEDPGDQILFGFEVNFDQNGRIHIKTGGQWSVKVWEINLNEGFSVTAGIREQLKFLEWEYDTFDSNLMEGDRELPYSVSLSWLTDGAGIDSIDSFEVAGAGIRKTLSLQHETYREVNPIIINGLSPMPLEARKASRSNRQNYYTREREDTTRGILITNDDELEAAKRRSQLKRDLYDLNRRARLEEKRRAEREMQLLNRTQPLP